MKEAWEKGEVSKVILNKSSIDLQKNPFRSALENPVGIPERIIEGGIPRGIPQGISEEIPEKNPGGNSCRISIGFPK